MTVAGVGSASPARTVVFDTRPVGVKLGFVVTTNLSTKAAVFAIADANGVNARLRNIEIHRAGAGLRIARPDERAIGGATAETG